METNESPLYVFDFLDDPAATLILQLQNRDIEELIHASKGKSHMESPQMLISPLRSINKSFKK